MTGRTPEETPMTDHSELTDALEAAGLLQDEYPDQMAARSCTCTDEAMCGAHRLLGRYEQLFSAFQESNREKRARGQEVALLRRLLAEYVAGNRIVDGYWYSPDENGEPHNINDRATADELALVESLRTEAGL